MTQTRQLAHLPCFRLATDEPAGLGPGRLVHLSWEEWQDFDSDYPFEDRRFERTRPLFYEVVDGDDDLNRFRTITADNAYLALTIRNATVEHSPAPVLSVAYELQGSSSSSVIGPLEMEALIWGLENFYGSIELDGDDVRRARSALHIVEAARNVTELNRLLAVLELTARPEVDAATSLVLCLAALEDLLIGEPVDDLRKTFSRRVASVAGSDEQSWQGLHRHAHMLYRLRSDIVHGDTGPARLEKLGLPSLKALDPNLGRNLVRGVLVRITAAMQAGLTLDGLAERLDLAAIDPMHLQAINELVQAGNRG